MASRRSQYEAPLEFRFVLENVVKLCLTLGAGRLDLEGFVTFKV